MLQPTTFRTREPKPARDRDEIAPLLRLEGGVESVEFNFTNRCNLRCVYCPQGSHPDDFHADTPGEQLDAILRYIDRHDVRKASVGYYGETTMIEGWEEVCEELLDRGVEMTIVSNFARSLSDREVEVLSRFSEIQVSIDSVDAKTLRAMRKAVDVRSIVFGCQRIQAEALLRGRPVPRMIWTGVLTRQVVMGLTRLVAMAATCSIRHVNFNSVGYFDGAKGESLHVCDLPEAEFVEAAQEIERAFDLAAQQGIDFKLQDHGRIMRRLVALTGRTRVLEKDHYLASLDALSPTDRIFVYGSGEPGRYVAERIAEREDLEFAGFLDSSQQGEAMGWPVQRFADYRREREPGDLILVCSAAFDQIESGLREAGIERYLDARDLYLAVAGRSGIRSSAAKNKRQGIQGAFEVADDDGDDLAPGWTRLCDSPWSQTYTDPKGEVYSCCQRGEVMGRINAKKDLSEVLNEEPYQRLRRQLLTGEDLPPECSQCTVRPPTRPENLQRRIRARRAGE